MATLTRRRKLLWIAASGGMLFLAAVSVAALRWSRAPSEYRPGETVEGITSELARDVPSDHPNVTFTDATREAGIAFRHFNGKRHSWLPEDMGSGAAWGDFDNDGWEDLVVANEVGSIDATEGERRQSPARAVLYHNERNGTFRDVTTAAGIDFHDWGMSASWADYDNDGNVDLLITAYGHNVLYHNNHDGTFTDRSDASGIGKPNGFWTGAAWGDYDRDGYLDLYVTGYVQFTKKSTTTGLRGQYDVENPSSINPLAFSAERNLLFHNNRDGTFSERAVAAGVLDSAGRGLAASWVDLDEDGWLDLYVANDVSRNSLFRNTGNGKFEDIGERARVSDYRSSMGIAVGDWNGDGHQDFFLTHWLAQGNALYVNKPAERAASSARALAFMDESDRFGLGQVSLDFVGWATSFIDYDNDGLLDIFVVNGSTLQKRDDPSSMVPMLSKLFWNRGAREGFFDVSQVSGSYFHTPYVGRGAAFADYDNDGDIDVFVVNHGGPGVLLRNDGGNRRHWLGVQLRGTKSNRQGLGAEIRLVAGGASQVRQVGAQSPYLSQNSVIETFGVGANSRVDTLEVRWPSGARDVRTGVAANTRIVVIEGEPAVVSSRSDAPAGKGNASLSGLERDRVQRFWSIYRQATRERVAFQTAMAAQSYARALDLNPDHEDALYYAGSMRLELGDFVGAASAWRHLLRVNPSSARTHSQLGALHQCLDRDAPFQLDSAERHFRRAHELNQEENGPLVHLGEVALQRGDQAVARRYFSAVLATDSTNAPAHFYTGYLAFAQGDMALARDELRRVVPAAARAKASSVGAPGEGDTKHGSAPLRHDGSRCGQLQALLGRVLAPERGENMTRLYTDLDRALAASKQRARSAPHL